jgi:hypothetical protein
MDSESKEIIFQRLGEIAGGNPYVRDICQILGYLVDGIPLEQLPFVVQTKTMRRSLQLQSQKQEAVNVYWRRLVKEGKVYFDDVRYHVEPVLVNCQTQKPLSVEEGWSYSPVPETPGLIHVLSSRERSSMEEGVKAAAEQEQAIRQYQDTPETRKFLQENPNFRFYNYMYVGGCQVMFGPLHNPEEMPPTVERLLARYESENNIKLVPGQTVITPLVESGHGDVWLMDCVPGYWARPYWRITLKR